MYSEYSLDTYGGADAIPVSRKATENKTKNHHFGVHSPGGKINNKQKKKKKNSIYTVSSSDKCSDYNGDHIFLTRDIILSKVINKKS